MGYPGPLALTGVDQCAILTRLRLLRGLNSPSSATLISLTKNLIVRHQLIQRDQELLRPLDVVAFQFIFLDQFDLRGD